MLSNALILAGAFVAIAAFISYQSFDIDGFAQSAHVTAYR
jgi:hypothetical protein